MYRQNDLRLLTSDVNNILKTPPSIRRLTYIPFLVFLYMHFSIITLYRQILGQYKDTTKRNYI